MNKKYTISSLEKMGFVKGAKIFGLNCNYEVIMTSNPIVIGNYIGCKTETIGGSPHSIEFMLVDYNCGLVVKLISTVKSKRKKYTIF